MGRVAEHMNTSKFAENTRFGFRVDGGLVLLIVLVISTAYVLAKLS
jgi:hypothetical protein